MACWLTVIQLSGDLFFIPLRLRDTGCMDMRCCTHNQLIMYCDLWRRTALWYTIFLIRFRSSQMRFHSNLGNKVISITFLRDWRELLAIFQDTPFQARKTEILEVQDRDVFLIFSTTRTIIQKSSRQSLSSICVVSILERQVLQIHTTLKSLWWKFELYTWYIFAPCLTPCLHCHPKAS